MFKYISMSLLLSSSLFSNEIFIENNKEIDLINIFDIQNKNIEISNDDLKYEIYEIKKDKIEIKKCNIIKNRYLKCNNLKNDILLLIEVENNNFTETKKLKVKIKEVKIKEDNKCVSYKLEKEKDIYLYKKEIYILKRDMNILKKENNILKKEIEKELKKKKNIKNILNKNFY